MSNFNLHNPKYMKRTAGTSRENYIYLHYISGLVWWRILSVLWAIRERNFNICNRNSHKSVNQKSNKGPLLVLNIIILWRIRILLLLKGNEKSDWGLFKVVADNFLGKHKAPDYRTFVKNMFEHFRYMGHNIHSKCNFTAIWIFASKFWDARYGHSDRLHQDIYNMKKLPRELESSNAYQLLLATPERNSVQSTYIHTHIPWIHECVPKTVRCGKSHRYLNIHNFYSIKYE